ncbi:MAG: AAA family ATPase [Coriobacteriales bacterium]|jgi:predicted AAA+ superfamily ATPase|nr:AAA family ATPase [Coriobacteriales bacterium]
MKVIGRKAELARLRAWTESDRPEFIILYGRRRVGKTFLVREFFDYDFAFQVSGLEDGSLLAQLQNFNFALARYGHRDFEQANTWLESFEQLIDMLEETPRKGRLVVFFDEMPWMDTPNSGFMTALEHFWNGWASAQSRILMIVCGSATTWMTNKLLRNRGGLHNRVTGQIPLKPFDLRECEAYFNENGHSVSRYQMLESYMAFGGVPYYLSLMDKALSLEQNIDMLCFADNALLASEYNSLYASLFKSASRHIEVVEALAVKLKGLDKRELVASTGLTDGGGLTRILEELELCGFIRRYHSFGKKSRGSIYQLTDAFTLFYVHYMQSGANNDEHFWLHSTKKGSYHAWAGLAFEQVCLAHIRQIKQKLGISGVLTNYSAWQSKEYEPGAQIDLVIDRDDNTVNLCEMKFSNAEYAITSAYEKELRNKRAAFEYETKTKKATHLTMVTTYGLKRNAQRGIIQSEVTMSDLFA